MGTTVTCYLLDRQHYYNPFNMKSMFLVALFVAVAVAAPLEETVEYKEPIAIVKSAYEANPETGKYTYSYETANGIKFAEAGEQRQIGAEADEIGSVSSGSYSYDLEGVTYKVDWVADESGFKATGAHLPVAPPMPAHVVKLLADLRAAGQLE